MLHFKKKLALYLWLTLSFVWLLLISIACLYWWDLFTWGKLAPPNNPTHRTYAIITILMLWLTLLLYFSPLKAYSPRPTTRGQKQSEDGKKSHHEFLLKYSKSLLNKHKQLILVANFSRAHTQSIIENLTHHPPDKNSSTIVFHSDQNLCFTESKLHIYIEFRISIENNRITPCLEFSDLIQQLRKRKAIIPLNALVIVFDSNTIKHETTWNNTQALLLKNMQIIYEITSYIPPVYSLINDAETINGFNDYFHHKNNPQNSAMLGANLLSTKHTNIQQYKKNLARDFNKLQNKIESQMFERIRIVKPPTMRHAAFSFAAHFFSFQQHYQLRLQQLAETIIHYGGSPIRLAAIASCQKPNIIGLKSFFYYLQKNVDSQKQIYISIKRKTINIFNILLSSLVLLTLIIIVYY